MPLYDYDCSACGRRFEVIHALDAEPPARCPLCGSGPVRKAFAPPAIHFKGSGWAKKERRSAAASKGTATDGGEADGSTGSGTDVAAKASDGGGETTASTKASTPSKPSSPAGSD
jgi:putative FmdB family regulatory protein